MFSCIQRTAMSCWRPVSRRYSRMNNSDSDNEDAFDDSSIVDTRDTLLWTRDLGKHCFGEYSFAIVQANATIEDHSQIEIGRDGTFVGVYDGHGGHEASRYVRDNLFAQLTRHVRDRGTMSEEIIRTAVSSTEQGFLNLVGRTREIKPLMAAVGSCCLFGLIWRGTLYIANLGDSRAVVGVLDRSNKIIAEQLTRDHNASLEEVRQELTALHPDDAQIVVPKNGVWRIKGIIQVSRSIGDAYLKRPEFALDRSFTRFHVSGPTNWPVLSSEPSIFSRVLRPNDRFLIFASDGLWELLTNQQACEIVHRNPRAGIARRLVVTAQNAAARRSRMDYNRLKRVNSGDRRQIHDDITVIVVFLDNDFDNRTTVREVSVRGYVDADVPSSFNILEESDVNASSVI